MAPKRPPLSDSSSVPKRKRNVMTVNEKVKLLDMLEAGSTCSTVARIHGLNESTVRYIKKDEENIRRTASVMLCSKRVMSRRNEMVVQMENALSVWNF